MENTVRKYEGHTEKIVFTGVENGQRQYELWPKLGPKAESRRTGILLAALIGIILIITASVAIAQEQRTTRTHACTSIEEATTLARYIIDHGRDGYMAAARTKVEGGICHVLVIAVPAPVPPVLVLDGRGFSIGVYLVTARPAEGGDVVPLYALLLRGTLPVEHTI